MRMPKKNGAKVPPLKPSLAAKPFNYVKKIFSNLTIEPPLFMSSFSSSLEEIVSSQLLIYKSCRVDFEFNTTVCNNLVSPEFKNENTQVQDEIAQFNAYTPLISSLFPVFFAFYLGAWSDIVGRKFIIILFLTARVISGAVLVLMARFIESPKEWYFLSIIPSALAGGYGSYAMAIYSFISDISKPEDRAFRMSMLTLALSLARPIGPFVGAYLLEEGGFVCLFSTSTTIQLLALIFLAFRLRSYKFERDPSTKTKGSFNLLQVKDSLVTTFRKRPGSNRKYLIVLFTFMFFLIGPYFGEYAILYLFVRTKYGWEVTEYSRYSGIIFGLNIFGLAVFVPVLTSLGVRDTTSQAFLAFLTLVRHISRVFAIKPWIFYLGDAIDTIGSHTFSLLRALISSCVPPSEYGKVFAVYSAIESLSNVGFTQIYATVWKLTSSTNVSLVFFLSIAIFLIAFVLSIYILVDLKGKSFADVTSCREETVKTDEKLPPTYSVIGMEFKITSI